MATTPRPVSDEEMTPTLKGAVTLRLLQVRGQITAAELARELGCHLSTAYDVLQRLELSRDFSIVYERPYWYLRSPDDFRSNGENELLG
jgi:sugar-specific transcriptional regulator TrmB